MRIFVPALATALAVASLAPAQPDPQEIARRSDDALRGKSQHARLSMTARTPDWTRTLEMESWWVTPDKTFIRITAPAKEAGTATLRLGQNMWNYLPQVERVIKIPPSLMLQPWMGSDFTNDDLVKESSLVEDYRHALQGEETQAGDRCFKLLATPKPGAAVVWGKLLLSIRTSDFLPRREEYYDERGELTKVLTFDDMRETGGRPYPMRWTMTSVARPGHETVLAFDFVEFDRPIPDRIFTEQNLKRVY